MSDIEQSSKLVSDLLVERFGFELADEGLRLYSKQVDVQHTLVINETRWGSDGEPIRAELEFGIARLDINELWRDVINPAIANCWPWTTVMINDELFGDDYMLSRLDSVGSRDLEEFLDEWISMQAQFANLPAVNEVLTRFAFRDPDAREFPRMATAMLDGQWDDAAHEEFLAPVIELIDSKAPDHPGRVYAERRVSEITAWLSAHPDGIERELTASSTPLPPMKTREIFVVPKVSDVAPVKVVAARLPEADAAKANPLVPLVARLANDHPSTLEYLRYVLDDLERYADDMGRTVEELSREEIVIDALVQGTGSVVSVDWRQEVMEVIEQLVRLQSKIGQATSYSSLATHFGESELGIGEVLDSQGDWPSIFDCVNDAGFELMGIETGADFYVLFIVEITDVQAVTSAFATADVALCSFRGR